MIRFFIVFAVTLTCALTLMAGLLAQNGYSLFAPEMLSMVGVCFAVALYVAWRITTVLRRRDERREDAGAGLGDKKSSAAFGLGSLVGGKSRAQIEREARFAAKKRQLIAAGKIAPEEGDLPPPAEQTVEVAPESQLKTEVPKLDEAPTRVAATATMREKMAARAERVRRAREEGKI